MFEQEIWEDIKGYEGLYEISNFGNIKSLERIVKSKNRYTEFYKKVYERNIKFSKDKDGYLVCCLNKNGIAKQYLVHRLVALTFIPNPKNLPCINHKDENPSNNHSNNLEWCTYKYNSNYGNHNKNLQKSLINSIGKKICKCDLNGNLIQVFNTISEASKATGIDFCGISSCCMGIPRKHGNRMIIRKTAGGFKWKYFDNN